MHRASIHEVYLTDSAPQSPDRIVCAAQLPRFHALFSDRLAGTAVPDLLLLLEVTRQTSILAAHRHLGVPVGYQFILNSVDISLAASADRHADPAGAATVDVNVLRRKDRDGIPGSIDYHMGVRSAGGPISDTYMSIQCWTRAAYDKLRKGRKPGDVTPAPSAAPVEPWQVGRRRPDNVVIGAPSAADDHLRFPVRVDVDHPHFFDHPLDHVPGMLLLEAYRQAAQYTAVAALPLSPARAVLTRCSARFTRFAEIDSDLVVTCRMGAPETDGAMGTSMPLRVEVGLEQDGVNISTAQLELFFGGDRTEWQPLPSE